MSNDEFIEEERELDTICETTPENMTTLSIQNSMTKIQEKKDCSIWATHAAGLQVKKTTRRFVHIHGFSGFVQNGGRGWGLGHKTHKTRLIGLAFKLGRKMPCAYLNLLFMPIK